MKNLEVSKDLLSHTGQRVRRYATESGELTEFTESFIKASLTSAEALLGLINQILDFAKFEGAKDKSGGSDSSIELSEDVWTLRQLIEQVTDISQKASSRGVDLVINIANPEHFNTKFVGDFFRLRQCCVNLVGLYKLGIQLTCHSLKAPGVSTLAPV